MNYEYLYECLTRHTAQLFPNNEPPNGNVVYAVESRASVGTLKLTFGHMIQSPNIHLVNTSSILISVGFKSAKYPESTLYVCWVESEPDSIILWERHSTFGITFDVEKGRFQITSEKFSSGREEPHESFISAMSHVNCGDNTNDIFLAKESEVSSNDFIYIDKFISEEKEYSIAFLDDDEFDPSGSISALRVVFDRVCNIGTAMIAAIQLPWCNMKKTILNSFKAEWEQAINTARDNDIDGLIFESVWLPIMWFHVIGCPPWIYSTRDLLSVIHTCVSKSRNFSDSEIVRHFQGEGFTESLSRWMVSHRLLSTFKEDIQRLSKPVSWNSYLCEQFGLVCYTHLHVSTPNANNSAESTELFNPANPIEPTILRLSVAEGSSTCSKTVTPLALQMDKMKWFPSDFARSTFRHMQHILEKNEGCYILGHCCAEQAIVNMGIFGLTPYATYENKDSFGHGMYFFRMDSGILNYSFDQLNNVESPCDTSPNFAELQFRASVDALYRVFINASVDAMSPSVLLFVVPVNKEEISPYDAINYRLPICNDDENVSESAWKCTCERSIQPFDSSTILWERNYNLPIKAADVCNMITMMPSGSTSEKFNAFALRLGIVDYNSVQNGVYKAITADSTTPTFSIEILKDQGALTKWKKVLLSNSYRRPIMHFNQMGMFSTVERTYLPGKGQPHWEAPLDDNPVEETCFVTRQALSNLLQASSGIFAIFLSPDSEYSSRLSPQCHGLKDLSNDCYLSVANLLDLSQGERHNYWKLRTVCKMNHASALNDEI